MHFVVCLQISDFLPKTRNFRQIWDSKLLIVGERVNDVCDGASD